MNLEMTKLFRDCCIFDLKQALNDSAKKVDVSSLDGECFSALIATVEPKSATDLEEKQFYDWVRVQFPTLFYGLELWLRKHTMLAKTSTASAESSNKV